MKRFLSVTFAVLMIAGVSACKKNYRCECTYWSWVTSVTYTNVTKKVATDACDASETAYKKIQDPNASCELK